MAEAAECPDFAGEVGDGLRRGAVAGKHLDGDHPFEERVLGLEHVSHAAMAKRIDDAVLTKVELMKPSAVA